MLEWHARVSQFLSLCQWCPLNGQGHYISSAVMFEKKKKKTPFFSLSPRHGQWASWVAACGRCALSRCGAKMKHSWAFPVAPWHGEDVWSSGLAKLRKECKQRLFYPKTVKNVENVSRNAKHTPPVGVAVSDKYSVLLGCLTWAIFAFHEWVSFLKQHPKVFTRICPNVTAWKVLTRSKGFGSPTSQTYHPTTPPRWWLHAVSLKQACNSIPTIASRLHE